MANAETMAIQNGKLIDGTGAEPLEKATVIIEGSTIKEVGAGLTVPRDAAVVDATGKTIMPGLIDAHLHISGGRSDAFVDRLIRPRELGLIKSIQDCRDMLNAGYTMAKCCGGTNAVYLKKSVKEGTLTDLPRIVASGYVLSQTFGHADRHFLPMECVDARTTRHDSATLICDGADECIKATRYALRFGADFIKVMTTGGVLSQADHPDDVQFNMEEIRAVVETAAQVSKFVTTHCQNSRGSKNSILGGIKTIDHANETNSEIIDLALEHGAIFVSTLAICHQIVNYGQEAGMAAWGVEKAKVEWEVMCESIGRIKSAGAPVAAGTDFSGTPLMRFGQNAMELDLLARYSGFTPMEAIVAATRHGAMACFMEDKTGTLEPGKLADIIVVDGDPLDDLTILQDANRIKVVILEGKVTKNLDA